MQQGEKEITGEGVGTGHFIDPIYFNILRDRGEVTVPVSETDQFAQNSKVGKRCQIQPFFLGEHMANVPSEYAQTSELFCGKSGAIHAIRYSIEEVGGNS